MERRKDIIAVAIIILVVLIRFSPFIFFGYQINTDSWKSYYPWRASYEPADIKTISYDPDIEYGVWFPMVKADLEAGRFPNWNPNSFSGAPLYANHLVPVFHLPFAIALLWPGEQVQTAYALIMALMGPLFFYWFLRNWRISVYGAFFAAMAYFFSGWLSYLYSPEVATLVWIPAILVFHDRFLANGRIYNAVLGAFCAGQLLIAGYPIFVTHFLYVMVAYIIWRRCIPEFNIRMSFQRWLWGLILIAIGGLALSAVQNIPTYEFIKLANRTLSTEKEKIENIEELTERKKIELSREGTKFGVGGLIYDQLRNKTSYLAPFFQVHRTLNRNFVGPIVILMGLIGLFCASRRYKVLKILFMLFSVFALVAPVYILVSKIVPGWSISIYLPREVFSFLLFFIAAVGIDALVELKGRSRAMMVLSILVALTTVILMQFHPILDIKHPTTLFRWSRSNDLIFVYSFLAVSILLILLVAFKANGKKVSRSTGLIAMVLFTSTMFSSSIYIFQYFENKNPMPLTEDITSMVRICSDGRIVRYDDAEPKFSFAERFDYVLPPNLPAKYGVMDIFGYDSLIMKDYFDYLTEIDPKSILWDRSVPNYNNVDTLTKAGLLTCGAGMGYVVTRGDLPENPLLDEIATKVYHGGIDIYRMKNSVPLIRAATYRIHGPGVPKVFPHKECVTLEEVPKLPDGRELEAYALKEYDFDNCVGEVTRTSSSLKIPVNVPSDCLIYISETYHPRWKAKLDGREVKVLKANGCFSAVSVPSGKHELYLWYDGIEVVIGGMISAISFILLVLIIFFDSKKTRPLKKGNTNVIP